jgi:signal peptidase I
MKEKYTFKKLWHDWLWPLIWAVLVVKLVINPFILEAYEVPTGSMETTILPGDRLIVEKFTYGLHIPFTRITILPMTTPKPGNVVVFKSPYDGLTLVKRCVATGGDTVEVRSKRLFVNGREIQDRHVIHRDSFPVPPMNPPLPASVFQQDWEERHLVQTYAVRDNFGPVVVPQNSYFMMGDNRDESFDSRFWGPVPRHLIRGRALFIYWSWDKLGEIPLSHFWERLRPKRTGRPLL